MKNAAVILLVAGIALLCGALALPEGYKEEQGFMHSAQERSNMLDHGSEAPDSNAEAQSEANSARTYSTTIQLRTEHFLLVGLLVTLSGAGLLLVATIKKSSE